MANRSFVQQRVSRLTPSPDSVQSNLRLKQLPTTLTKGRFPLPQPKGQRDQQIGELSKKKSRSTFNSISTSAAVSDSLIQSTSCNRTSSSNALNLRKFQVLHFQQAKTNSSTRTRTKSTNSALDKQFQVYQQVFDDIIKQNTAYGSLLANVKTQFDTFIKHMLDMNGELRQHINLSPQKLTGDIKRDCRKLRTELEEKEKHIQQLEALKKQLVKESTEKVCETQEEKQRHNVKLHQAAVSKAHRHSCSAYQ